MWRVGDGSAASRLADLLARREDLDEAEQILRARADAGDGEAPRLAGLLILRGRGDGAERLRRFGFIPGRVNCLRVKSVMSHRGLDVVDLSEITARYRR